MSNTSVKTFSSTDPGALVLSGTPGSLLAILKTYLVDGRGAGSVQGITVAGGVATATYATGHPFAVNSIGLFAGAVPAGLNGEQRILTTAANSVTFAAPGVPDGVATGSMTSKLAAAGWAELFAGTVPNVGVFKSPDVMGTGMHLRVDDTGTTVGRVMGYEQMTAASSGVGSFPTAAQISGGGYWPKSDAANSTARAWTLFADSRKFYMHFVPYSTTAGVVGGVTFGFGDDLATRPGGDPYACSLASSFQSAIASMSAGAFDAPAVQTIALPRAFTGLGSSSLHAAYPYTGNAVAVSGADSTLGAFPSEVDGGLRLSKRFLIMTGGSPRCDLPGLYHVPQSGALSSFARGATIPGTGALAGRKLMSLNSTSSIGSASTQLNTGVTFVDITGPWR